MVVGHHPHVAVAGHQFQAQPLARSEGDARRPDLDLEEGGLTRGQRDRAVVGVPRSGRFGPLGAIRHGRDVVWRDAPDFPLPGTQWRELYLGEETLKLVIEMLVSPVHFRVVLSREPVDAEMPGRLVDALLRGITPR